MNDTDGKIITVVIHVDGDGQETRTEFSEDTGEPVVRLLRLKKNGKKVMTLKQLKDSNDFVR